MLQLRNPTLLSPTLQLHPRHIHPPHMRIPPPNLTLANLLSGNGTPHMPRAPLHLSLRSLQIGLGVAVHQEPVFGEEVLVPCRFDLVWFWFYAFGEGALEVFVAGLDVFFVDVAAESGADV